MDDQRTKATRREFLKASALVLPFAAIDSSSAVGEVAAKPIAAPRTYFNKGKRLSISMWDFSWLMAHYPGGAYEDLDRRLAEAAERGYNTLRVDCFPSRMLERESTFPKKNWTPGVNLPMWGESSVNYTCNVRKEVAAFADLCRKHGIWLGLDTWDRDQMFWAAKAPGAGNPNQSGAKLATIAKADEERVFTAYGEVWARALKLMREDGVLERAVWVAPLNEVPWVGSRYLDSIAALKKGAQNEGETKLENAQIEDSIYKRINHWMAEPIHAELASDRIPLCYSSLGAERYAQRLTDLYDVVDIHFMPSVLTDKEDDAALARAARGITGSIHFAQFEKFDLKAWSQAWDRACQKHYPAMLERVRKYFHTALSNTLLPSGKQLTAIATECFGPTYWPDSPEVDWKWYQHYNSDALRIVAEMDLAGSTLSNFAEPLFTLWNDADWQRTSNTYFQTLGTLTMRP